MKQATTRTRRGFRPQPQFPREKIARIARLKDETTITAELNDFFNKHSDVITDDNQRRYFAEVCPKAFAKVLERATIYFYPDSQERIIAAYAIARLHSEFDLFPISLITDLRSQAHSAYDHEIPYVANAANEFLALTKTPEYEVGDEAPLKRRKKHTAKVEDRETRSSESDNLLGLIRNVDTFKEFQRAGLLGFFSLEETTCTAVDGSRAAVKNARKKLKKLVLEEIKNPVSEQSLDGAFAMLVAIMNKFGQLSEPKLTLLKRVAIENQEKVVAAGSDQGIRDFLSYIEGRP
jgi:hypothetical protein